MRFFFPLVYGVPAQNIYWLASAWIFLLFTIFNLSTGFFQQSFLSIPVVNFSWLFLLIRKSIFIIALCLIGFLLLNFMIKNRIEYSRFILGYFGILSVIFLVMDRLILIGVIRIFNIRKRIRTKNILIIGAGRLGRSVLEKIEKHFIDYQVVGFLDERIMRGKKISGTEILGKMNDLVEILSLHKINRVFISIAWKNYNQLTELMKILRSHSVSVTLVPDIYQYDMLLDIHAENLDGMPIISLTNSPINGWNLFIKRLFDIIFSLLFLLIFSPLYLGIILLLLIVYRGRSIFYRQERMGMDQKIFKIIKFRTMIINSEKNTGPVWAKSGEERMTKIGKWLRKTSLDEIPQFFNVLVGHMSVVGPRPERPHFIEQFKYTIPKYMLRHKVKAGVTGWAQANGFRGNTSLKKRIEYDIHYLANWSLFFDIKIICRTAFIISFDKNAY